ncbi:unnamed protein product [Rotaria socialis]
MYILSIFWQQKIPVWDRLISKWLLFIVLVNFANAFIQNDDPSEILDIQPKCVLDEQATFAISRAKTDYCKTYLKEISCEIASNPNFFPSSLPRFCPIKNGNFGEIIGCALNTSINTTSFIAHHFNTSIMCIDFCLKYEAPFAAYGEFTGHCNCWRIFNNASVSNIFAINHTCSDWFADNDNRSIAETVTLYRTSFVPVGTGFKPETPPNQISLVFFFLVSGRKSLRQNERYLYRELSKLCDRYSNIVMAKIRYRTTWGSTTRLLAELDVYKQLIEDLKWNFSFVISMSESDFPIKPIEELSEFLSMFPNKNFIVGDIGNTTEMLESSETRSIFVFCDNYLYRLGHKKFIQNIIYEFGSDWTILSRDFINYVTYGDDELIRGLRLTFNFSALPSESFYHTAVINSVYCDKYIRHNLRMVNWDRKRGCTCFNRDVGDLCGCSPVIYRRSDKKLFAGSTDKPIFFARKFDPTIDENIIDWIDEKVFGIDLSDSALYLQNFYHVEDSLTKLNDISGALKSIELYTRTMLVKHPKFHPVRSIELQQIHAVFELGVFQGYTFQYTIDDRNDFEIFVTQNAHTNIFSDSIKQLDIGFTIDTRDTVFIDRSRTFLDPVLVTVLFEWKYKTNEDISLVMKDPSGIVVTRMLVEIPEDIPIVDVMFPEITTECMIGIWSMDLVSNRFNNTLASLDFLIVSVNEMETNNDDNNLSIDVNIVDKFWPIAGICSVRKDTNVCSKRGSKMKTIPYEINDCDQNRWSAFYYDVKTNW